MDQVQVLTMPAIVISTPTRNFAASPADAARALTRLRLANPGTTYLSAVPSEVPGFIKLTLAGNKLAYTDKSGRYLFLGAVFDMSLGIALDGALDGDPSTSPGETPND